jgi:hypothetical protein
MVARDSIGVPQWVGNAWARPVQNSLFFEPAAGAYLQVWHRRRSGGGDEGCASGERGDKHGQPSAAVNPAEPRDQISVYLWTGVEGLLPRVHENKNVVGADCEHYV